MTVDSGADRTGEHAAELLRSLARLGTARISDLAAAAGIDERAAAILLSKLAVLGLVERDQETLVYQRVPSGAAPDRLVHEVAAGVGAEVDVNELVNRIVVDVWGENVHQGYWHGEDDDASNQVATEQLTDLVIAQSGLADGDRVLDIGCGVGSPAIRLAETVPVEIVGISNTRSQIEEASRRAAAIGLDPRVRFEFADALDLPFPEDSFDVVWMIELLAVLDRERALDQAWRVLRPGGRLVLTDQLLIAAPTGENRRQIEAYFAATPATLLDADGYRALLAAVGFDMADVIDVSDNTRRTAVRMIEAVDRRHDELIASYGRGITPLLEMFRSPVPLLPELGYAVLSCRKPA